MEETTVASGTTTTNSAEIQASVRKLNVFFNEIETKFHPALEEVNAAQTADTWTSIPACQDFRVVMLQTLAKARAQLDQLWGEVSDLCTNLQESAAALEEIDTAASDALTALMKRASDGPPEATPPPPPPPGYRQGPGGPTAV